MHVMMHAPDEGNKSLPHGMAVQNTYAEMVNGSKSVVVVVRNLAATPITLEKNTPVARVVAANTVPHAQIQPGMVEQLDVAKGVQTGKSKMTKGPHRKALFEQLDLSGLDSWMPKNSVAAHLLLAEYHDILSLDMCELGCTDIAQHVIQVMNDETFKEKF